MAFFQLQKPLVVNASSLFKVTGRCRLSATWQKKTVHYHYLPDNVATDTLGTVMSKTIASASQNFEEGKMTTLSDGVFLELWRNPLNTDWKSTESQRIAQEIHKLTTLESHQFDPFSLRKSTESQKIA